MPDGSHSTPIEDEETGNPEYDRLLRYAVCPQWPADVFAVAATLMDLTGCYTEASLHGNHHLMHGQHIEEVSELADEWRDTGVCPEAVKQWWVDLVGAYRLTTLAEIRSLPTIPFPPVVSILMKLLMVADEASVNIGWVPRDAEEWTPFAERTAASFLSNVSGLPDSKALPHVPMSICDRVPPDRATVLPKALTPAVGCTVRSMSHHLALLPPNTVLASEWVLPDNGLAATNTMRLLVIPFPFRVDDESFIPSGDERKLAREAVIAPYFTLAPTWLERRDSGRITAAMLKDDLIVPLIQKANAKFGKDCIDGVLFPECALTEALAQELQDLLEAKPIAGLKFLIAGTMVAGRPGNGDSDGTAGRNLAKTMVFGRRKRSGRGRVVYDKAHSKHHRWALDKGQINRYGLTGIKAPNGKIWEHIVVKERRLPFLALRDDLCMTVLICEDLARADPAMPVVRAIGPNLVVALLMDGPQLAVRWPGRYATVLAEDPGSSVLSITSAGMVDRSNLGERNPARAVGLWRHDQGSNTELYLPPDHHGLVLTIEAKDEEQYTFDHRSDHKTTKRWKLETVTPLAVDSDWL
ncbi:hypothetical protein [Paraburkholderia largidicola]|uniref:Uncharacterized protein n=1 Tax=Paraburkholderia largidicola TaxID=3014751 RepID=A0A7I8BK42_9BURK|nr:hypothetical protein [Paraburkholderia sp. PGU16]BCF89097.1 hypothetical protein PPGU16_21640 [Paraburkholderia sp. PGU16]